MKCQVMDWDETHAMIKDLYLKIKKERYKPDVIIAIARGGFHPARELCDYLRVKEIESINVEHWGVSATPSSKAKITKKVGVELKGKKVLVVDDISDTGESLKVTIEYLEELGPKGIKTATMQIREGTQFPPDFYVEALDNNNWIIHPWTEYEDYTQFLLEQTRTEKTMEEIKQGLKEKRGLEISNLEEILDDMEYWGLIQKEGEKWKR